MARKKDEEPHGREPGRKPGAAQTIVALGSLVPPVDHHALILNDLVEQTNSFALGSFEQAARERGNPQRSAVFLKQGLDLARGCAALVAASDSHRKALRKRDERGRHA
ncbi:hypothetical protein [Altericroceibacterium xinjiangense]|uniref:hypothetical protein n=1 Tax=Altericroceibacterium xinjiangense TaxID=762261 RepID=UPI000F7E9445|nr:hypothetical protein [Altericroceibacterium xinjiangense]